MRVISIFICLSFVTGVTYCQNNLLFKKITATDNLKIICLTDHLDSLQVNKRFTFYCEKKVDVTHILETFTKGDKSKQMGESKEVHIYILKEKEIQPIQIMINPRYENINTNVLGNFDYYHFDTSQLVNAHKKYLLNYICKRLKFESKMAFDNFLLSHENDDKLLCYKNWTEKYPGRGMITIKKDKVVRDGFKGEDYLDDILKKLTSNDEEYSISFLPEEADGIFTFAVDCSKEVFDKIKSDKCQKKDWIMNKFELLTYWRQ